MVKYFDPSCPKCKKKFHVHHEDLRHVHVKLHCPYCGEKFFVEDADTVLEHDGTITHPRGKTTV
jgi:DNA-directed RNA polymerase subunit RPC12/RpoP